VHRLRATLRTFRPVFSGTSSERVRGELHWLSELLGAVRDRDVLRERVDALPADKVDSLVLARIRNQLDAERTSTRATLGSALDSERYAAIWRDLGALTDEENPRATSKRLRRRARRAVQRAGNKLERADALHGSADRDVALHGARKAHKRARY